MQASKVFFFSKGLAVLKRDTAWEGMVGIFRVWNPIKTSYIMKICHISNFRHLNECCIGWYRYGPDKQSAFETDMKFVTSEMFRWKCLRASELVWQMLTWQLRRHPFEAFEISNHWTTSLLLIIDSLHPKNTYRWNRVQHGHLPRYRISKIFQEIQRYRPTSFKKHPEVENCSVICFPVTQMNPRRLKHGFVFRVRLVAESKWQGVISMERNNAVKYLSIFT